MFPNQPHHVRRIFLTPSSIASSSRRSVFLFACTCLFINHPRTSHSFVFNPVSAVNYTGGLHSSSSSSSSSSSYSKPAFTTLLNSMSTASSSSAAASPAAASTAELATGEILAKLRSKMKEFDLDAFLVPSDDPHLSEYTALAYRRRAFVSKFTGSAGTALILADDIIVGNDDEDSEEEKEDMVEVEGNEAAGYKNALLWTDSRYFNEAGMQLDFEHWTLMKQGQKKTPTITAFLTKLAKEKKNGEGKFRVGIDAFVHSASFCKELNEALEKENGIVCPLEELGQTENLVDEIWGDSRPALPSSAFRVHPLEYAGASVSEKLSSIRKKMKKLDATLSVFSTLDDIAYLLNVRASDVDCNPVGVAYCTVSMDSATLYCDESNKLTDDGVRDQLRDAGVVVAPYETLLDDVRNHVAEENSKVWVDTAHSNYAIASVIPKDSLIDKQNAVTPMKACKNENEMDGMRKAHIVDGVAMAEFMEWLENEVVNNGRKISEVELDIVLCAARARQPGYIEPSFPTIAGVGSNGAIIHYRAKEDELMKYFGTDEPILIDSGGQYEYGTTDVTRTWHLGEATEEFKEYYTRVLKGNIGVDSMVWPENTPGFVLDVFARKALWDIGKVSMSN